MAVPAAGVDISALHAASEIRKVRLVELRVDRSYQRDPSQKLVDDIAANWDEVSSELILVSYRGERVDQNGGYWVVNGQHRSLGARKRGLEEIDARVIDLSQYDDPAAIEARFRLRTNVRLGDKSLERFKAELRAGDPEALAIQSILERYGTEIGDTTSVNDNTVKAVAAVERIFRVDDTGALLSEMLETLRDIHGVVGGKLTSGNWMLGVAWFILKHGQDTDRNRFVDRLQQAGPAVVERRARAHQSMIGGSLWFNFYRAFLDLYNENLTDKNKLKYQNAGSAVWKVNR